MVSVSELKQADPGKWRAAADDAVAVAKQCDGLATHAREDVARTVNRCWVGESGRAATERFVKHADDYETSAVALRAMAKVYDDLADAITAAQRDLNSALDYARTHDLKVEESGRVQLSHPVMAPPGSTEHLEPANHAQGIIVEALRQAAQADTEAARALRTIEGLTAISDPKLAKEALTPGSPLAIALALSGGIDGLHPVNVSPAQIAAVNRASAETGISRKLLLAIPVVPELQPRPHGPAARGRPGLRLDAAADRQAGQVPRHHAHEAGDGAGCGASEPEGLHPAGRHLPR